MGKILGPYLKIKNKKSGLINFFFFFWGLILEALSFYEKIFWALSKKMGLKLKKKNRPY
jgi:hypothetical protein